LCCFRFQSNVFGTCTSYVYPETLYASGFIWWFFVLWNCRFRSRYLLKRWIWLHHVSTYTRNWRLCIVDCDLCIVDCDLCTVNCDSWSWGDQKNRSQYVFHIFKRGRRGRDRMVVGFTTTYMQSVPIRCTTLSDKVCQWLATGRWFSPGSSTNKTDRHDITEILLKVALNTTKQTNILELTNE
jgi:hypothetical protein